MSINFNDPMNAEAREMFRQMIDAGDLPQPVAMDDRRALFNDTLKLEQKKMKKMGDLARAAKQSVAVELNEEGEIKEMADGTKYKVTPRGWVKVDA